LLPDQGCRPACACRVRVAASCEPVCDQVRAISTSSVRDGSQAGLRPPRELDSVMEFGLKHF